MATDYCMRCGGHTQNRGDKIVKMAHNKRQRRSTCSRCGAKKCSFVHNQGASKNHNKGGSFRLSGKGFLGNLLGGILPF